MKHQEGTFEGEDRSLVYHTWAPEKEPKGCVELIHGFAEHLGRYDHVINLLIANGFAVCGHDRRGHGKSAELRDDGGFVNSFHDYVKDSMLFHDYVSDQHPDWNDKPWFLLGHSMGSLIAVMHCVERPGDFDGIMLSGYGTKVGTFEEMGRFKKMLGKFLSKIAPKTRIKEDLNPDELTHDEEMASAYLNDPSRLRKPSVKLGIEWMKIMDVVPDITRQLSLPMLFQHGSEDVVMRIEESEIPNLFTMEDKTIKMYKGLRHEVYNELEANRKIVLDDLVSWLNAHA